MKNYPVKQEDQDENSQITDDIFDISTSSRKLLLIVGQVKLDI